MPPSDVEAPDSRLFHERAQQYRSLASFFSSPARALLLEVAADYERMADRAEKFELEETNRVRSS